MYRIIIEKIETVARNQSEYQQISDTGNKNDGGATYGYVDVVKNIKESTQILEQVVDDLDIPTVIRAINGLA